MAWLTCQLVNVAGMASWLLHHGGALLCPAEPASLTNTCVTQTPASIVTGDLLFSKLALPLCPPGRASVGQCLQLDLKEDSGDDLEDMWADEQGLFWGTDDNADHAHYEL